jgi:hypothetical protein
MKTKALSMTILREAATSAAVAMGEYSRRKTEKDVEPYLLGYLRGANRQMLIGRQTHLTGTPDRWPKRVDLRGGGMNPKFMELAVQPHGDPSPARLMGSQNISELRKLSLIPRSQTRQRVLILVDLSASPASPRRMKQSFDKVRLRQLKRKRHSVRILYCHASTSFSFLWRHQTVGGMKKNGKN